MNVQTLRRLDFWIGLPVCFFLTLFRYVFDFIVKNNVLKPGKILFVKLAEQGSTVIAVEALEHAARMVGSSNVYFLVFEENRFIVDALKIIPKDNVIAVRNRGIIALASSGLSALLKLHRTRIDTAIDLEFFSRFSATLSFLSGAKIRSGFHNYKTEGLYRGDLFTHRVIYNPHLHTSSSFLSLVCALEAPATKLPATPFSLSKPNFSLKRFEAPADEQRKIEELLKTKTCTPTDHSSKTNSSADLSLILLNANCSDMLPLRRWPHERYVLLARNILAKYPEVFIAFTGTKSEAAHVHELVQAIHHPHCFSVAGDTSLPGLLTLYNRAEILVTNDSGPAHFAALTDIDVITLFGPETPKLFGSLSPRNHNLWAGLACSPCVSAYNNRTSACRDNLCMQFISENEVFAKVCEIYERRINTQSTRLGSPTSGLKVTNFSEQSNS